MHWLLKILILNNPDIDVHIGLCFVWINASEDVALCLFIWVLPVCLVCFPGFLHVCLCLTLLDVCASERMHALWGFCVKLECSVWQNGRRRLCFFTSSCLMLYRCCLCVSIYWCSRVSDGSSAAYLLTIFSCVLTMVESGYLQIISHRVAGKTQARHWAKNQPWHSSQNTLPLLMRRIISSYRTWLYWLCVCVWDFWKREYHQYKIKYRKQCIADAADSCCCNS